MSKLGAGFVRVSTGSQDEASQIQAIIAAAALIGVTIVKWFKLHGYSASHGTQEPALRTAIADIERGDYTTLIVTDSSRLDRREDLDAQAEILLAIRSAGGDIVSIDEPQFGKTDFAGRIVTLVAQHANAQKSKTVKSQTHRGIMMIRDNKGHHGALPAFWETKGVRYAKQAYCADPEAVKDIYERVANSESLASIGRKHSLYPQSIKNLVKFTANHTGVIDCSYTYDGQTDSWAHTVAPVVDSPLWWRANKVLDANMTEHRQNKGGRPVAWANNWISGVLDCPECGGKVYLNAGNTPAGNPRTPKLRCGGYKKERIACGRFKGCDAKPVIDAIAEIFSSAAGTKILSFQRIAGNAHDLDALKASLARIQGTLSATENDNELDRLIAERKAVKAQIESFVIVPDSYDHAETGQTLSEMWNKADDAVKRVMVRAVKTTMGLDLSPDENDRPRVSLGVIPAELANNGIVDLGGGICFRSGDIPRMVEPLFSAYSDSVREMLIAEYIKPRA
jgi:DNA invertase Pin-like site-specific DNA recombinase